MRMVVSGTPAKTALLCAVMVCLSSCAKTHSTGDSADNTANAPPLVPVTKAARANLASDVVLTAEFQPYQQVEVMAKVSGYVRSIDVDMGDRVRTGQVLATLEIPEMEDELAKAAATIGQADAELSSASDELQRSEAAHALAHLSSGRIADVLKREPGLVPQQEVDEARSRDLMAEAQVSGAKSGLRTAEQKLRLAHAEQARIQTLHKYMTITAPFDGVVTKRYANAGAMIQAGISSQTQAMPLVQVSQNNLLRLILPVPESAVGRVRVGEMVEVRVSSMGRTFQGRVVRFADDIQPSTRTMDTEVDVPNPTLTLIPGMYAEVNLRVEERRDALSVPLDAVDRNGSSVRIYTVTPQGLVQIVPVTLGLEDERLVEVRSGLHEGDLVVVGRRTGLRDGQPVQTTLLAAQVH
jgi:RND family efflux transporter MFP subunit